MIFNEIAKFLAQYFQHTFLIINILYYYPYACLYIKEHS